MASLSRQPRRAIVTAALVALVWTGSTPAHAGSSGPPVPETQDLVALLRPHDAYVRPRPSATRLGRLPATRPITGGRTVLPVIGDSLGRDGSNWLHVRLPGRPNGRTGWISESGTVRSTTPWHIVVDISSRRTTVYDAGRPARTVTAVVGKPSTPTPLGQFFVEEAIELAPSDIGAPYALALSARSEVLQEFNGGPGQIGLHGLAHVGGTPGTAASHGCVRLDARTMRWLVTRVGPGTPVTIIR